MSSAVSTGVHKNTRSGVLYRSNFAHMKIFTIIISFFSFQALAQKPAIIAEYISNYQQYAISEQLRTGIPAAITMAQAIHESGAGQGDLALKSNNHFGIKCKSNWTGDRVFHDDDATGECFRSYICVADSYRDHSDFLKSGKRYSFLFDLNPEDYQGWAFGLKQAGYATNPKYPQILLKIIQDNNLGALTETALDQNGNLERDDNNNIWLASSKTAAISSDTEVTPDDKLTARQDGKNISSEKSTVMARQGIFKINHCKAILVPSGTALKKVASQYGITLKALLEFNELKPTDKLVANQVIFLEEKRKKGGNKIHEVQNGETAWLISQQEGMRLIKLQEYNRLAAGTKLKAGQLLYLRGRAPK